MNTASPMATPSEPSLHVAPSLPPPYPEESSSYSSSSVPDLRVNVLRSCFRPVGVRLRLGQPGRVPQSGGVAILDSSRPWVRRCLFAYYTLLAAICVAPALIPAITGDQDDQIYLLFSFFVTVTLALCAAPAWCVKDDLVYGHYEEYREEDGQTGQRFVEDGVYVYGPQGRVIAAKIIDGTLGDGDLTIAGIIEARVVVAGAVDGDCYPCCEAAVSCVPG